MEVLGQEEEEDGVFLSHSLCWVASEQQLGLLHSFIPLKDCGSSFCQMALASRLYFYHVLLCSSSWKSKVARLSLPFAPLSLSQEALSPSSCCPSTYDPDLTPI